MTGLDRRTEKRFHQFLESGQPSFFEKPVELAGTFGIDLHGSAPCHLLEEFFLRIEVIVNESLQPSVGGFVGSVSGAPA